ncbi:MULTISPECIES: SH3 domain-containing protein [Nostocales]|uniref:SH3 domain-containing protein n=3 Tax=Nostocales TaxID=1161 RepID=A0A0C1N8Z4_9CYAN|nr:SH3 domain-containing protein [Tolypothrix bouteillei]KAF3885219.1 SH3 domain-containing protein [Tolypothrix bouteillei VB521301]
MQIRPQAAFQLSLRQSILGLLGVCSLLLPMTQSAERSQAQQVSTRFSTQERCFGYRVFDLSDRTVNLRQSANGPVIKTVSNGTQVFDPFPDTPPIPPGGKWTPVTFQGQTLYVSTKFLYRAIYLVFDPNDSKVNVRQQPNGRIIKSLPNETEIAFIEPKGDWTKVRLAAGEVGYVSSKLLKKPSCF